MKNRYVETRRETAAHWAGEPLVGLLLTLTATALAAALTIVSALLTI